MKEPLELSLEEMRQVAESLFKVEWMDGKNGFLECPGKQHHTKGDGVRDCKIALAGGKPPTIFCFHQSCETEVEEANRKLRSALGKASVVEGWRPAPDWKAPPATSPAEPKPTFRGDKLEAFASRWRPYVDTAWLANRSPVNPFVVSPEKFLATLYRLGEHVVIFTDTKSQGQALWPNDKIPLGHSDGVWFLAQPVDGKFHDNPRNIDKATGKPRPSRRSEEAVTSWRFLVLESDQAKARDWLAALVQLPLRIVAIYTSGKRSIHALIRVDAPSVDEWRSFSMAVKPILVTLGADRQVAASAVRLTRLPGCYRGESLQKLLYLNPDPPIAPITGLPLERDVVATMKEFAEPYLATSAGDVIARAGARNLTQCIEALDKHRELVKRPREPIVKALAWFESNPVASDLLGKLRRSPQTVYVG